MSKQGAHLALRWAEDKRRRIQLQRSALDGGFVVENEASGVIYQARQNRIFCRLKK